MSKLLQPTSMLNIVHLSIVIQGVPGREVADFIYLS